MPNDDKVTLWYNAETGSLMCDGCESEIILNEDKSTEEMHYCWYCGSIVKEVCIC